MFVEAAPAIIRRGLHWKVPSLAFCTGNEPTEVFRNGSQHVHGSSLAGAGVAAGIVRRIVEPKETELLLVEPGYAIH
jgi:hypothetical protein